MTAPKRRWPRYSLRTLFVGLTILGTGGYWIAKYAVFERASKAYERASTACEVELAMNSEVCKASLELYHAQTEIPFSNLEKAAIAHLERIRRINTKVVNGIAWDYDVGPEERTIISQYYAEAERLASDAKSR